MSSRRLYDLTHFLGLLGTARLIGAETAGFVELSVSRSTAPAPLTLKRDAGLSLSRTFDNDTYAVNGVSSRSQLKELNGDLTMYS